MAREVGSPAVPVGDLSGRSPDPGGRRNAEDHGGVVDGAGRGLRMLTVHAHPDDESSKGAATVARYVDEGVRAVLVCCTGGEEGDILNPAADLPGVRERLAEVRRAELDRAAAIIGYHEVLWLGYRDSGYPEAPDHHEESAEPPELPEGSFGAAPLDEATERLVAIVRAERPHVMIIYPDDQQGYRHPDHLRVHEVGLAAYRAAGDPQAHPAAGAPWRPRKLYYSLWAKARILALHEAFGEAGLESPYQEWWFDRPWQDERITTRVEVERWYDRRCDALLAHATQVDPDEPFWFGLPREVAAAAYPWEDYILAASDVATELPEEDLFAGLRAPGG